MAVSDRDAMAALAARLMGGTAGEGWPSGTQTKFPWRADSLDTDSFETLSTTTRAQCSPSAAAKATIPGKVPRSQSSVTPVQSPPSRYTATTNTSTPPTPTIVPAAPTMAASGPSLYGTADQLEAAREFLSSATQGAPKSQGSSRAPVLSSQTARSSKSSASGPSSRLAPAMPPVMGRPRPSTSGVAGRDTTDGLSQWGAFKERAKAQPSTSIKREDSVMGCDTGKSLTGQSPHPSFDPPKSPAPSSPARKKENVAPQAAAATSGTSTTASVEKAQLWQMKNISNILHDRASNVLPAHLRGNSISKAEPITKVTSQESTREEAAPSDVSLSLAALQIAKDAPSKPSNSVPAFQPAKQSALTNGISAAADGAIKASPMPNGTASATQSAASYSAKYNGPTNGTLPAAGTKVDGITSSSDDTAKNGEDANIFQELKQKIMKLTKRVGDLESENLQLRQQVQVLVEAGQRRKFMGTDSKSVPFGLEVKNAQGRALKVQASADLSVGELIRVIRLKANLSADKTKNPRISFNEQQLGHIMTLGEAGVDAGSSVLFTFEG